MANKTQEQLRAAVLGAQQARAIQRIDEDVDAIYGAAIGNRQAEYEAAERQAQAYADAGYTGAAPAMVASWAGAKGWAGQQAADDILLQAGQSRVAQELIRAQRLERKEQVRTAMGGVEVDAALATWARFVTLVRQQLGV